MVARATCFRLFTHLMDLALALARLNAGNKLRQDCDDGNHNQEFDQGERLLSHGSCHSVPADRAPSIFSYPHLISGGPMGLNACKGFEEALNHAPWCRRGGIGRRARLKIWFSQGEGVRAPPLHQTPLIIPTSKGVGWPTWPWRKKSCGGFPLSGSRRQLDRGPTLLQSLKTTLGLYEATDFFCGIFLIALNPWLSMAQTHRPIFPTPMASLPTCSNPFRSSFYWGNPTCWALAKSKVTRMGH